MASNLLLVLAICTIVLPSIALAAEYIVGDTNGWTIDFNYQAWTNDKVFHVGDRLVFQYTPPNHNVFKVNGSSFKDCIIPSSNGDALTTGNDVVTLATPGKKWYICGVAKHCAEHGQKLVIDVIEEGPAPAPSAAHEVVSSSIRVFIAVMVAVAAIMMQWNMH
ncbi:blue copper protein-like [Quillaja saponaria]|uniref:Blue copper protein-like n=1 Tax=Quillaja saponaria TaxID=32244 RepID=A0AAD7L014_QUISA|nr:blue copper protein-like [Quillaja saponaria]